MLLSYTGGRGVVRQTTSTSQGRLGWPFELTLTFLPSEVSRSLHLGETKHPKLRGGVSDEKVKGRSEFKVQQSFTNKTNEQSTSHPQYGVSHSTERGLPSYSLRTIIIHGRISEKEEEIENDVIGLDDERELQQVEEENRATWLMASLDLRTCLRKD